VVGEIEFVKGHGAQNDFVLIPDPDATMPGLVDGRVADSLIRSLCDRRTGIGADGVLRVVRSVNHPDAALNLHGAPLPEWFMDFYNADGTAGEMCGNGVRVFARYLAAAELADPAKNGISIGTRAGVRTATFGDDASITVDMGVASVIRDDLHVSVPGHSWAATSVDVGNPHLVAVVDDVAEAGSLLAAPVWTPAEGMPHGANVEFVQILGPAHVRMRVHERGVGETKACGTGACAAALVASTTLELPARVRVDLPGGTLFVTLEDDGRALLTGPAELTFFGRLPVAEVR
jgi:diaminopimelate epimerase